jgi:hypothetical protein
MVLIRGFDMGAKRSAIIASIVLACVVAAALVVMYQSEDRMPVEAELAKYPQFAPFLVGRTNFRGIRFNVDTNLYSFAFTTSIESPDAFFSEVTKALSGTDWKVTPSDGVKRVYVRRLPRSGDSREAERVTLTFNPTNREVTLLREAASL